MERFRFRASIYLDVFIENKDGSKTLEEAREDARQQVLAVSASLSHPDVDLFDEAPDVCNSYVGGVAHYTPRNLLKPLDREI